MKLKANKIIYSSIINNISFEAESGHIVTITGHNTMALSTLMSLSAGLVIPPSGTITVNGRNVMKTPYNIGYIYDPGHLDSIRKQSAHISHISRAETYTYNYVIINHQLDTYGYISYKPTCANDADSISFIMRSMLDFPDIIVIDEPFADKNDNYVDIYCKTLRDIVQYDNKICIIATSSNIYINSYADKIISLN